MNTSSENNPLFCTPQDGVCLIATSKETKHEAGLDSDIQIQAKKSNSFILQIQFVRHVGQLNRN